MARKNAKLLIQQALFDQLATLPLDKIDVQDVAQAAHLSRQTFYYNFKNKQDLLCCIMEEDVSQATESFQKSGNLRDYITSFILLMQQKSAFYCSLAACAMPECSYAAFFENGLLNCAQMVESNSSLGSMSTSLWDSLHFFTYGASGMLQNWLQNKMQPQAEQLTEMIMNNLPPAVERYMRGSARR